MGDRFKGRTAIVTGGGSGIGRATSLAFAAEGASVAVADVDRSSGEDTLREVIARGGRAIFIEADVASDRDAQKIVDQSLSTFGRIDILHNNAGISLAAPVTETSAEDWDRVFGVNLKGAFLCSRYAIPEMAKRGAGVIVNMASVVGLRSVRRAAAYAAAEAGVISLTRSMALDHADDGIRVNCVCAGLTDTGMLRRAAEAMAPGQGGSIVESWSDNQPLGRVGTPEDMAKAVLFLASDDAGYITGTPLMVDGGVMASLA